jgi:hypothetical protein
MVSQLLFGETFEIMGTKGSWSYIRSHFDDYEGWITTKMIAPLREDELNEYKSAKKVYVKEPVWRIMEMEAHLPVFYLAGGSTLLEQDGQLIFGSSTLGLDSNAALHRQEDKADIIGTALKFLNTPYLWGGRTVFGIDCSGYTQIVYKMNGMVLPRDASQQAELGKTIQSVEETHPGDLAFFENDKGSITHTGIILENVRIIHSSGKVHIDKIDKQGIYNVEKQEYSHKLAKIKRFF